MAKLWRVAWRMTKRRGWSAPPDSEASWPDREYILVRSALCFYGVIAHQLMVHVYLLQQQHCLESPTFAILLHSKHARKSTPYILRTVPSFSLRPPLIIAQPFTPVCQSPTASVWLLCKRRLFPTLRHETVRTTEQAKGRNFGVHGDCSNHTFLKGSWLRWRLRRRSAPS